MVESPVYMISVVTHVFDLNSRTETKYEVKIGPRAIKGSFSASLEKISKHHVLKNRYVLVTLRLCNKGPFINKGPFSESEDNTYMYEMACFVFDSQEGVFIGHDWMTTSTVHDTCWLKLWVS